MQEFLILGKSVPSANNRWGRLWTREEHITHRNLELKKSEEPVMEILREHGLQHLEEIIPSTLDRVDKVFVNGKWVGVTYEAQAIVDLLRSLRRKGDLFEEVSMLKPLM